mmetsp:Transcript_14351/g.19945  ORF Transcript_14351/g.19945 Transcript_14351/m.19945 type:complete len:288 (+) Transcript_14351:125-988(+)|eukprot:CAMPEP_0185266190 /NCGR_PEP_ID=MMETSP1359-20130426/30262_1 /TAXON_ID=552665 /ORGANISM="Bigelowiella longifila, Strain CCMP242" /LENGTH=287 /DNA_ID=CAMNT_0027855881 /DNA_START=116 /DNA_END=979 /DNA_ORIENTATION=-
MGFGNKKNVPFHSKVAAGGVSGVMELCFFHPVDTVAKRLMTNRGGASLSTVAFGAGLADAPVVTKWMSLYPGFQFATAYKIMQRTYKFGMQPVMFEFLQKRLDQSKVLTQALAGACVGAGEVVLLPFDVLKIRSQTNPESVKGRGMLQILLNENLTLYRGWNWTIARNVPGSFALFGGNSLAKAMLGLDPSMSGQATVAQNAFASIAGATCSIAIAAPMDVIKTRIQQNSMKEISGVKLVSDLVREEGFSAFFKGLGPKILVVGPKLVFSMTIAQSVLSWFARRQKA